MEKYKRTFKILIVVLPIILIGCKTKEFVVTDTKFYKEQYLPVYEFATWDIDKLEKHFGAAGFVIEYEYVSTLDNMYKYMVLTPEMIEYVRPKRWDCQRDRGVLKRRHIRELQNSL